MTQQKIGLIIIAPVIIATALLLMRQGALGAKGVVAVSAVTVMTTAFLFLNQ